MINLYFVKYLPVTFISRFVKCQIVNLLVLIVLAPNCKKTAAPVICASLAYICNLSLCTSVFPSDWKAAKVTPIHKSGDKSNVVTIIIVLQCICVILPGCI